MRRTSTLLFFPLTIALILAACGGGNDDDPSAAAAPAKQVTDDGVQSTTNDPTPTSYAAQLQIIVHQADVDIIAATEQFKAVTTAAFDQAEAANGTANAQASLTRSLDVLLEEALKVGPVVIPIIQRAIDDIESLDPPDQFTRDQARFLDALRQQLNLQTDLADAAADGDVERFYALAPRTDDIENALFNDVSPEFRASIAAFLDNIHSP